MLSMVIPTYNSEKNYWFMPKIDKNQSHKNIEIVIIDRFSKDRTVEIAKSYGARIYQLDCERTKAKNFGLRNAKGKYVLYYRFRYGVD